jgi:hypothetical protein
MGARVALIAPRIDMARRNNDSRIALVLQPVDEFERGFLEEAERELVIVVFMTLVPAGETRSADRVVLGRNSASARSLAFSLATSMREFR